MKIKSAISVLRFNGKDCFLEQQLSYPFPFPGIIIDFWLKVADINTDQTIFHGFYNGNATITIGIKDGNVNFSIAGSATASAPLAAHAGKWVHAITQYDHQSGQLSVWLKGKMLASVAGSAATAITFTGFYIGRGQQDGFFTGVAAIFRIWQSFPPVGDITHIGNKAYDANTPGLAMQYTLCDPEDPSVFPNSGNQRIANIQVRGAASLTAEENVPFYQLIPDNVLQISAARAATYTAYANLSTTNGFSLEFWWKLDTMGPNQFFSLTGSSRTTGMACKHALNWENGPSLIWTYQQTEGSVNNRLSSCELPLDFYWHHWALVYDFNKGTVDMYCDGKPIGHTIVAQSVDYTGAYLALFSNGSANMMAGQLAELRLWDKPITAADIQDKMYKRLKPSEPELAAYFPFSGRGRGYNPGGKGGLSEMPQYILPADGPFSLQPFHQCVLLNGGDSAFGQGSDAKTDQVSIGIWLKRNRINTREGVFYYQDLALGFEADNTVVARLGNTVLRSAAGVPDFGWQHFTLTYDRTAGSGAIYKNGVPEDIGQSNNMGGFYSSRPMVGLGQINPDDYNLNGNMQGFKGSVFGFAVWDRILSAGEIDWFRNMRLNGHEKGLLHYWPLDDDIENNQYPDLAGEMPLAANGTVAGRATTQGGCYTGERDKLLLGFKQQAAQIIAEAKAKAAATKAAAHSAAAASLKAAHEVAAKQLNKRNVDYYFVTRNLEQGTRKWTPAAPAGVFPFEPDPKPTYLLYYKNDGRRVSSVGLPPQVANANPAVDPANNKLYWAQPTFRRAVCEFPVNGLQDTSLAYRAAFGAFDVTNSDVTFCMKIRADKWVRDMCLFSAMDQWGSLVIKSTADGCFVLHNMRGTEVRSTKQDLGTGWITLFVVYTRANSTVSFYVNGSSAGSGVYSIPLLGNVTRNVSVGVNIETLNQFSGEMAMVRIFRAAYYPNDLNDWYYLNWNLAQTVHASWVMDVLEGQQGYMTYKAGPDPNSQWLQLIPKENFRVPTNIIPGRKSYAVKFNSDNALIYCSGVTVGRNSAFMFEFWLQLNPRGQNEVILSYNNSIFIEYTAAGHIVFTSNGASVTVDKSAFDTGWHLWNFIMSDDQRALIIKLDDIEVAKTGCQPTGMQQGDLILGAKGAGGGSSFGGLIGLFKVYEKEVVSRVLAGESSRNFQNYYMDGYSVYGLDFYVPYGQEFNAQARNCSWVEDNRYNAVTLFTSDMNGANVNKKILTPSFADPNFFGQAVNYQANCTYSVVDNSVFFGFVGGYYNYYRLADTSYTFNMLGRVKVSCLEDTFAFSGNTFALLSPLTLVIGNSVTDVRQMRRTYDLLQSNPDFKVDHPVSVAYCIKTGFFYIQQGSSILEYAGAGWLGKGINLPEGKEGAKIFMRPDEQYLYLLTTDRQVWCVDLQVKVWAKMYDTDLDPGSVLQVVLIDAQEQVDNRLLLALQEKRNQQLKAATDLANAHQAAAARYAPYQTQLAAATKNAQDQITQAQANAAAAKAGAKQTVVAAQNNQVAKTKDAQNQAAGIKSQANAQAATMKSNATATANQRSTDASNMYQQANQLNNSHE